MNLNELRKQLVELCLKWEELFGVMPRITNAISEYDAMKLIGMSENEILKEAKGHLGKGKTAVQKGHDFVYDNIKYQIKANRPSGKKGSSVTLTPKLKNYEFDKFMWILYDPKFSIQEVLLCDVKDYREGLEDIKSVRPDHLRNICEKISFKKYREELEDIKSVRPIEF